VHSFLSALAYVSDDEIVWCIFPAVGRCSGALLGFVVARKYGFMPYVNSGCRKAKRMHIDEFCFGNISIVVDNSLF
jgi:hypothetical protein